jgi:TRAP-type C4-dicarboxylate transport system permease small subunit
MLKTIDRLTGKALRGISIVTLGMLFILLIGNVFFRFVPVFSFGWFDEIVEMVFAYFVFFGSAALWREREHFRLCLVPDKLKGTQAGKVLAIVIDSAGIIFFLVLFVYSLELTIRAADQTPIFKLSKRLLYVCIPIASFTMLLYSAAALLGHILGKRIEDGGCIED